MIKANRSWLYQTFFNFYINRIIRSDFEKFIVLGEVDTNGRSVLLIPNHFSWWDGFFAWQLNQKLFKRQFNVIMLEEQLKKHMFFSRIGAFSISPGSRSISESLNHCVNILGDNSNLLVFFPQGKINSQHCTQLKFMPGVERIIAHSPNVCVVFASVLVDYYSNKKPSVAITLCEYKGQASVAELEKEFNSFRNNCINNQDNIFTT
jgi:1-acyl-sn-glycerol-3-phosphate acyltransferase